MKTSAQFCKFYFARIKSNIMVLLLTSLFLFAGCEQKSSNQDFGSIPDFSSIPDFGSKPDFDSKPDFGSIKNLKEKKKQFFDFLSPIIKTENDSIIAQRNRLLELHEKHRTGHILSEKDLNFLDTLLTEYKIDRLANESKYNWKSLIKRVDIVPLDLALNQAAKESGWGTSRFACQGNNMFGQRCFTKGCGIVPNDRKAGEKHEVTRYDSVEASVRSYIYNLNTNPAYSEFRQLRFNQRQNGDIPDGYSLVPGLPKYSERRNDYLIEILAMIKTNRLYIEQL